MKLDGKLIVGSVPSQYISQIYRDELMPDALVKVPVPAIAHMSGHSILALANKAENIGALPAGPVSLVKVIPVILENCIL